MRNQIKFYLTGRYALFTDPLTKIGGEKSSLMTPTYQALKAICESIYWKPTITWIVESVKIINPIKTESKGIRPIKYGGGNDLAYYTYLSDVCYEVEAYFVFNSNRPDLSHDYNEHKHYWIAKRSLDKGGRRDICLGVRECQAYVEPVTEENKKFSCYENMGEMQLGLQYHSLVYPDESGQDALYAKFWYPSMVNGVIHFCKPWDCPKEVFIRKMEKKKFESHNFSGLEELELLDGVGGVAE